MAGTRRSPAYSRFWSLALSGPRTSGNNRSASMSPPVPAPQTPLPLAFHLFLERVEEAPIGALRDNLLRARLDYPGLMQAQGIETHRILRVVLAPFVVGHVPERLERIVVPRCEAPFHQDLRPPLWLER